MRRNNRGQEEWKKFLPSSRTVTVATAKIHGSGPPPPSETSDRDRRRFAEKGMQPSLRLKNIFFRPFYRESAFSRPNASVLFLTGQAGVNSESERVAVARKFSCPRPNPASINTRSASAGAASTNPAFYYFPFLFIPSPSFPDPPPSQDQEPVKFGARFTDRQVSPGRGSWAWISRAISFSQIKHSGNKVWPFLLARARERSLLSFLPSRVHT